MQTETVSIINLILLIKFTYIRKPISRQAWDDDLKHKIVPISFLRQQRNGFVELTHGAWPSV